VEARRPFFTCYGTVNMAFTPLSIMFAAVAC